MTSVTLLQFEYDAKGRVTTLTDRDGNQTRVERDATGAATAVVAPFGQRTTLSLDGNGLLRSIVDPAGGAVGMTYAKGLLETYTDARGGVHRFEFDPDGRLIKDENPAGGSQSLTRTTTATGFNVDVTTAMGRTTSYRVDFTLGGMMTWTNTAPDGAQAVSTYDGKAWSTVYADGTMSASVEGPDPRFELQAPVDSESTFTTPGGLSKSSQAERSVELSDPANPLALKRLVEKTTINGKTSTSTYDAASRTLTQVSPMGRQVVQALDAKGRVVRREVAGLEPQTTAYDERGRVTAVSQGGRTTSFGYDGGGYLSAITDPLGRVVRLENNVLGRVTKQTGPDGSQLLFAYDANSNITSMTPPGRQPYLYEYTPVDLEASFAPPAVGDWSPATSYAYDTDRALTRTTRPDGATVDVSYDAAGRVSKITHPLGVVEFGYEQVAGRVVSATTPQVAIGWSYDGSLLTEARWSGVVEGSVGYAYDNDLRLVATTVNGGLQASLSYDDDGLLTQVGDLSFTRDPQNGLVMRADVGVVYEEYGYNGFGEVTSFAAQVGGETLLAMQYERDGLGRVARKAETIGGVTTTYDYGYDAANRLQQVTKDGTISASWTYDANGNRTSETRGGSTVTGTYDGQDRLMTYGSTSYSYGNAGELLTSKRLIENAPTQYRYDALGDLVDATLPDGTVLVYVVDGKNRRIGKKVNGTLTQGFLWEDQLRIAAETDGSGQVVSRFIYGTGVNVPELIVKGAAVYRVIKDHLGSPRLVVNAAEGSVAQQLDYDEWGNVLGDSNPGFQPLGFAGGVYDRHIHFVRFGHRHYDPSIGRFLQAEPMLQEPGYSLSDGKKGQTPAVYAYGMNNPVISCPSIQALHKMGATLKITVYSR